MADALDLRWYALEQGSVRHLTVPYKSESRMALELPQTLRASFCGRIGEPSLDVVTRMIRGERIVRNPDRMPRCIQCLAVLASCEPEPGDPDYYQTPRRR